MREARVRWGIDRAGLRGAAPLVRHRAGAVLAVGVVVLRRDRRRARRAGAGGRTQDAGSALVSRRRSSTSPKTCCGAATRSTAIVFWSEDRLKTTVTYAELYAEVSRLSQALRAAGVKPGDRVAGYLPNVPGTVIAMLAATSLGAIWSSCSPDFGVQGVLDRFGQIEPKVLFAADGYFYNGKTIDLVDRLKEISAEPAVGGKSRRRALHPATPADFAAYRSAVNVHDLMAPWRAAGHLVRAFPVRSPALHHVFLRHHRRAEVHRARRRRHAAPAPEGTPAARRPEARRAPVLLHDLRLDDVELARVRSRLARHHRALRRLSVRWPADASCSIMQTPRASPSSAPRPSSSTAPPKRA